MKYHFREIEAKWQKYWAENQTFKASSQSEKPKYYVLDMFPYPSGAGLHVGHPLGYIASDIVARYKRHKGHNVLHPMGYDSFGLPAEQYAIQTGQHPAKTTEINIARYRQQLDKIGFSFDWSREVRTSNPDYYKWTQWIFLQLFNSWYNKSTDKAEDISTLIAVFEKEGNAQVNAVSDENTPVFSAEDWIAFSEEQKQELLLKYRLTYLAEAEVNWCPALGTVLANDEVVNGVSERGGHPVIRKKMTQWMMRITAYAERLLQGLETIDWTESLKESQRNWIGKSVGALVTFQISIPQGRDQIPNSKFQIPVFTTRPDTIFGVSFMTLAPEHELVPLITTPEQKQAVDTYIKATAKRSERERMADVKTISGVFTGAYAEHPFTKAPIPIWIGDYVLAGYGTGAVMAVPAGDDRDYAFAKHFNIPIKQIFKLNAPPLEGLGEDSAFTEKSGFTYINSDFLNGLDYKKGTQKIIEELEKLGVGKAKVNYRLRDAVFSRQRYWGEPIPIYYKNGIPYPIPEECLPLELPEVEKYLPTEDGQPPLGNAKKWYWNTKTNNVCSPPLEGLGEDIFPLELNTMPGWAGSSWYWLRYMDARNENEFCSEEAISYWKNVDLYIGGSEHATGHLLYSRFWNKFLKDKNLAPTEEPFKKLINQGMILGMSAYFYRIKPLPPTGNFDVKGGKLNKISGSFPYTILVSKNFIDNNFGLTIGSKAYTFAVSKYVDWLKENGIEFTNVQSPLLFSFTIIPVHVDLSCISEVTNELDIEKFKAHSLYSDYKDAEFILDENGKYIVGREVEKMSKSKLNVVNPDDICEEYGADTLRLYEMFLGPLEQAKPWNTAGITGVHSFLKKLWKLYHSGENDTFFVSDAPASNDALKTLHKTIKKVEEDIEDFSFNTSVSTFMIAVNELSAMKCNAREVLKPLVVLISPYAPHIAEELWEKLGHTESISTAPFPVFEEKYLVESTKEYPISFNGKMRFTLELPLDMTVAEIEKTVLAHEKTLHYLEGRTPKKVIIVPGKVVNIVG